MIYDLTTLDYTKELSDQLKELYHTQVNDIVNNIQENEHEEMITLFHGTSLHYFNDMLICGLLPRNDTHVSNYKGELKSNEHLVYLTKKWHYWYGYNAFNTLLKEGVEVTDINIPCYIECKVPVSRLIPDEDFFHSKYIMKKIKSCLKNQERYLEITYEECLNHYGTVAHIGGISRDNIISITVLANLELLYNNFFQPQSQYSKDMKKWSNGKGKGTLKFMDLVMLEDDNLNLTFQMDEIPFGNIIEKIEIDEIQDKIRLRLKSLNQDKII